MAPKKQVSPVIRISQGERDASARATHLEAATRKFLVTTNERKQMSTKTNFKRISLVAIAALGMGLLSSVPSQAVITGTPTVTATAGTATLGNSDSANAATVAVNFFAGVTTDTATVTFTLGGRPADSSAPNLLVTFRDTATSTGVTNVTRGVGGASFAGVSDSAIATTIPVIIPGATNTFAAAKLAVHLDTGTARLAGTYTINYVVRFYETGGAGTAGEITTKAVAGTTSIVVSDGTLAAAGTVTAAGTSTAVMTKTGAGEGTDESDLSAVMTPSGAAIASIVVTQKTAAGLPSRESVTVTTSIGNLGDASTTALSTSTLLGKSITLLGGANGVNTVYLFADGTSGTATITIKTTSVTFSNKSAVFYSTTVAKIEAVALGTTLGGSAANVIAAKAYDASGNQIINNTSVYAFSSDLAVVNTGATTGTACSYDSGSGAQICSLSGATDGAATITLRNKSTTALSTVASNTIALTVNTKSPVALKLAFDKATYAPGEAAYVRLWAVDSAGNPVAPGARTSLLAAGGITSTAAFGNGTVTDSLTVNSISPTLGFTTAAGRGYASTAPIYLVKVFMPASGGAVTVSATGGSLLPAAGQVAVTATATVTDSGAAALAAVNALATTVASLRTLITTLTNLVLKIQKKVKA
jgi:trimeric autotransporter adhesin